MKGPLAVFNSVKLTVVLLSLIALTVLIGAWCPQEAQVGFEKVLDEFGESTALNLRHLGITDIFHQPWFLGLIGLLTINMVVGSMKRVFPKLRQLRLAMPNLKGEAISRLPANYKIEMAPQPQEALTILEKKLKRGGYFCTRNGDSLTAEFGKVGRLAPSITHIGLLSLLVGVTITSWTGFTGFQPVPLGGDLTFADSEHSKLWVGKLPTWSVRVNGTSREDYPTGEAKQWYSDLSVIKDGKEVMRQQISVNNPLTYDGVDIYQSSWGLDRIRLKFNDHLKVMSLRPMGKTYASFLPLDPGTILIFSVRNQFLPLRIFGKTASWPSPKMLGEINPGKSLQLGNVELTFDKVIPVTGLQYKSDPGLPVTYVAFGFIMLGVLLAAIPYRQLWAYAVANEKGENGTTLFIGGTSHKAKTAFAKHLLKLSQEIESPVSQSNESSTDGQPGEQELCPTSSLH